MPKPTNSPKPQRPSAQPSPQRRDGGGGAPGPKYSIPRPKPKN